MPRKRKAQTVSSITPSMILPPTELGNARAIHAQREVGDL